MIVETLEHSDVRGNKLWYMKLRTTKGTEHLINIGEKTFNKINELKTEEVLHNADESLKKTEEVLKKEIKK